jgi:ubiquinone/menaquinone biosynthesis C-methylase UbiE
MRKELLTDILSFSIGLIFTGFVTALQVPEYSTAWFILKFIQFIGVSIPVREISRFLFIPSVKPPEVPQIINAFDEGIINARYNFCSTSTKEIALWESPTFLYYLHLNTTRMISEKAVGSVEINFSDDPEHKRAFYESCRQLVADYGNGRETNILSKFNAVRFLIYPENVYRNKEKEIEALISVQAIGLIYCIPVIREKLLNEMTDKEKEMLQELSKKLNQKIEDEYTSVSRVDRILLKRKKKNNPYLYSIPDFLVIDAYGKSPYTSVWWYEGRTPRRSFERRDIELAQECFKTIAKVVNDSWDNVVWVKYSPELFTRVPIFIKMYEIPSMVVFFSQDYYRKWIEEVIPRSKKYLKLSEWIKMEEEVLKNIIKYNKITRMLDIGCGWGRLIEIALESGIEFCAGVDIVPSLIDRAKDRLKRFRDRVSLHYEDATKLRPFNDEYFDLVICTTNTFGNMRSDEREKVMKQIYRVLKRDGLFLLSVYANTSEAKKLREESYKEVGLRPYPSGDPTVILTQEGLYSKQFDWEELESYLRGFKKIEKKIDVDEIALIVVARK